MSSIEQIVEALCHAIVSSPSIRVKGRSLGYRNKIAYSLGPSALATSPLATDRVNLVATAVDRFRRSSALPLTSKIPIAFWNEVSVKETRRGDIMVKLVFVNSSTSLPESSSQQKASLSTCTIFEEWIASSEPMMLFDALRNDFGSSIRCVVAHVASSSAEGDAAGGDAPVSSSAMPHSGGRCATRKPGKLDAYVPLTPDGCDHVVEYTPNAHSFVLSPDSFCEVNHEMEDAIFQTAVEFLCLESEGGCPVEDRSAFMTGRDINSVFRTFESYYGSGKVTAVSTCPRVLADTVRNGIPCAQSSKENVWTFLEQSCAHRRRRQNDGRHHRGVHHVLITAGRHGLHPNSVKEMVRIAQSPLGGIDDVLYVSCNVDSMVRDVFLFKEAFVLSNCRTFDFFPQTDYVMSVLHFKAMPPEGLAKSLLVLPIGAPGSGKTSSGNFLMAALRQSVEVATRQKAKAHHHDAAKRRAHGVLSTARVLDVSIPPCVTVTMLERDALFAGLREAGASLAKARAAVHDGMLSACRASQHEAGPAQQRYRLTYLDSTNASIEARSLYRDVFLGSATVATTSASITTADIVELHFKTHPLEVESSGSASAESTPSGEDMHLTELLRRCKCRTDHPAFPEDLDAQRVKVTNILSAVKHCFGDGAESSPLPAHTFRYELTSASEADDAACTTHRAVAVLCGMHLFCDGDVARVLTRGIPWDVLYRRWNVCVPRHKWSMIESLEKSATPNTTSMKRSRSQDWPLTE